MAGKSQCFVGHMPKYDAGVSLADLAAAGVRLRPLEVVTIVRQLALQVAESELPGVPSAHVVRLSPAGAVFVEGPVAAGGRSVARAAQLLDSLLPGFDAPPEFRAAGALRLVVARALGVLDIPPYPTLDAFADALNRFAAPDAAPVVAQLVASWAESVAAQQPDAPLHGGVQTEGVLESFAAGSASARDALTSGNDLTVSDLRRARRATGLTLTHVGERSRIPISLLRELEWGYLRNWPDGHYGRTQLVRYARAAGLDEELVVHTVWPLLEEVSRVRDATPSLPAAVIDAEPVLPDETQVLVPVPLAAPLSRRQGRWALARRFGRGGVEGPSRRVRLVAALAVPALLFIALLPAIWDLSQRPSTTSPPPVSRARASAASTGAAQISAPSSGAPAKQTAGVTKVPDRLVPPAAVTPGLANASSRDGRPAEPLTSGAPAYSPAFSSVGTAMFYHAPADGRRPVVRADTGTGGEVLRITRIVDDRARNFHVRPSPDGSRIAFDSDRDGERAVYVADATGQNLRRITGEGFAAVPSWSPDGQSLAFVKAEAGRPEVWNLWIADLKAGKFRRLSNHRTGQPWGGSWFPDGRQIAYSHQNRLIILDLTSGTERAYPSPLKRSFVWTPSVSPDGRRVIFQVQRDGVWLLELKDGSMRKVLADPSAGGYTWSPDGGRVAYYSSRSGTWGVWIMAPR